MGDSSSQEVLPPDPKTESTWATIWGRGDGRTLVKLINLDRAAFKMLLETFESGCHKVPYECHKQVPHSPMYILHVELLVLIKKRPRRFFGGPGLRNRTARPQIDRGSRRGVFSSTFQRNAAL